MSSINDILPSETLFSALLSLDGNQAYKGREVCEQWLELIDKNKPFWNVSASKPATGMAVGLGSIRRKVRIKPGRSLYSDSSRNQTRGIGPIEKHTSQVESNSPSFSLSQPR